MINEFGRRSLITWTAKDLRKERLAEKEKKMRNYRGWTKEGKEVRGWLFECAGSYIIPITENFRTAASLACSFIEVIPETVGQFTGLCYEGDYVVMDCWNGGDGIDEPSHHDIFEGIVIYDKKICRFGLQTKLCDEGQIEVGLEDSRFTEIEILGNKWENPKILEQDNG